MRPEMMIGPCFQMAILNNQACISHELAMMDELDKLGDIQLRGISEGETL
jgi:hypothetical protein